MEAVRVLIPNEHDLYPIHEEDSVPQGPVHQRQSAYLIEALRLFFPTRRVEGDMCCYWQPDDTRRYLAPDVLVVDAPPPDPLLPVYLGWRDGALLFVGEVASPHTVAADLKSKLATYERNLQAGEYLFVDNEARKMRLWRRVDGRYHEIPPDELGRLRSATLDLYFSLDENGFMRAYAPSGEPLLTYAEQAQRADEAARRADDAEARLAEALAELQRLRSKG